ncbi:MAG: RagB/SusD family nutrient uptake outer membrane protein [Parabacteroides sp.]|nr:RagB/SusD family nutrient uptake outer membrane protein [Parabacteroides chartae]MDD3255738.1 RagB/SusD family nutrient uptake outer membrane protein [Parabacteroides sp.]MDT3367947.1 RagB/SusD family nutrient uptake outer membrane protein [Bacteroidota bacterium]HML70865.1 RagB/SusD family nutrient uptake outer membrane protein [Macellibacteroides fermentans]MDD3508556.1 RagB/SusD family nutrient uptake outer membrane protein [Parabacteroides sp.]MDD4433098.1 RagB/SusD family nutrient upta
MKHILKKQMLWALLLVMTFSSCSDFLDKLPENRVEAELVDYTKTSDMYMPVSGTYAVARNKFSAWMAFGLIAVRGDDVDKGSSPTDQIEFKYCKEFQYDRITGYWALNAAWEGLYNVISTSNAALESLDKYAAHITNEADRKKYAEYTAEVRFIRAFSYFRIVNLWGNAPLLLNNQELNLVKSSREEIYNFIYSELEYCVANLPALRPNEQTNKLGAVTRYTAQALLAKAYLYNENWDGVLAATNDIISSNKFSLYNDFYQLFKIPGKLSNESLFELQYTDFGNGSGDIVSSDAWFAFQGPRGGKSPIEGWGFMTPTDNVRAFFAARGETVRSDASFLVAGKTTLSGDTIKPGLAGEPTCYNGKAYTPSNQLTPGRTSYGANNNIRILRYADVLLMNAEAKIRKGQNGDAEINQVRERAKLAPLTGATLDQLLDERRAEFAMEWGERFFDLVRTDKAAGTLPGFVKGVSEYYPIPQNQIDLNPNLK